MTDAETAAFKAGYLLACCNLQNLHDMPGVAWDVLSEASITEADVVAMDLSEYDLEALETIRSARPSKGDPIAKSAAAVAA